MLRVAFITMLLCHIPFIFFTGKEALLIMIDEAMRSSLSAMLQKKVAMFAYLDDEKQKEINEDFDTISSSEYYYRRSKRNFN